MPPHFRQIFPSPPHLRKTKTSVILTSTSISHSAASIRTENEHKNKVANGKNPSVNTQCCVSDSVSESSNVNFLHHAETAVFIDSTSSQLAAAFFNGTASQ